MSVIDFAKKHPVGVGIGVIAIVGIVVLVSGAGGGTQTVVSDGSSSDANVAAGLQMQALQYQSSAQMAQTAAEREVSLAGIAASLEAKKLETQSYDTQAAIAGNIQLAGLDVQKQISSLQLANDATQIQASKEIQMGQQLTIQKQAQYQVEQTNAILKNQLATTKENNKPKGLFSFLFG